jgi:hypothetical protein
MHSSFFVAANITYGWEYERERFTLAQGNTPDVFLAIQLTF